ncbi:MAG: prepilin-type N-terminal cleavage/methylation domain-containing protein [Synechococcaceae cyanobacterium]|nr:prepilin-type N-terminal cleavage/methylation domain-containing protein [Synechococcaceae cyanobacterium]
MGSRNHARHRSRRQAGFTLAEVLVAGAIGAGVMVAAGQALVASATLTARAGRELREQEFRQRALRLIAMDLALARRLSAAPEAETPPCGGSARTTVLHLEVGGGRPAIAWAVGAAPSPIWRGPVLWRCGPAYGLDGTPSLAGAWQSRVVLDGLADPGTGGTCAATGLAEGSELAGSLALGLAVCRQATTGLVGVRLEQRSGGAAQGLFPAAAG